MTEASIPHEEEVVLDRVATVPNLISAIRLLLIPFFGWLFLTGSQDVIALVLLIVIGVSDWLDGYIARRTRQVSRLGKLLDPLSDRVAIVTVLIALTFRGLVPLLLAGVLLLRDLIVSIVFPILESKGYPRIPVNRVGKWATALIFTGVAFAAGSVLDTPVQAASETASLLLLVAGAVLYWAAGVLYVREIRKLAAARAVARSG